MFEEVMKLLEKDLESILVRVEKGKDMIDSLPANDVKRAEYTKQYNHLRIFAARANACLDILDGEATLIAEYGGSIVVAKKTHQISHEGLGHLVDEVVRLGGVITSVEDV